MFRKHPRPRADLVFPGYTIWQKSKTFFIAAILQLQNEQKIIFKAVCNVSVDRLFQKKSNRTLQYYVLELNATDLSEGHLPVSKPIYHIFTTHMAQVASTCQWQHSKTKQRCPKINLLQIIQLFWEYFLDYSTCTT